MPIMSYRQLLKTTNQCIPNLKIRNYFKKVYRKNIDKNISHQERKAFIQLLTLIAKERLKAIKQKKVQLTKNLNFSFIKTEHFLLDDSKSQIQNIFKKSQDSQTYVNPQLQKAYRVYMYIQFFYGINQPAKLFAKRIGTHFEDLSFIMHSKKKSAFIDDNLTLDFI